MDKLSRLLVLCLAAALQPFGLRAETMPGEWLITVDATLPGASIDMVARGVTAPLADSLSGFPGADVVIALSRAGTSRIILKVRAVGDPPVVLAAVRERLARDRGWLSPGTTTPRVAVPVTKDTPVAYVGFVSDTRPMVEVSEIAVRLVVAPLSTTERITQIWNFGTHYQRFISLRVDGARLAAYALSVDAVAAAIRAAGLSVMSSGNDVLVVTNGRGPAPEVSALLDLALKVVDGPVVRLRDIGAVETVMPADAEARFNGQPAVIAAVFVDLELAQPEATRHVRDALARLLPNLPADITVRIAYACTSCAAPPRR